MNVSTINIAMACLLAASTGVATAQPKKSAASVEQKQSAPQEPKRLSAQEIFRMGFEALQKKDGQGAVDLFRAGLETAPNDPNAWLHLSKAQSLVGDTVGAEQSKTKALALGVPNTASEPEKPPKIQLPVWPGPQSLGGVSVPDSIRSQLEEDSKYRLPIPAQGVSPEARPDFELYTQDDTEIERRVVFAFLGIPVSEYTKTTIESFVALTHLEVQGNLFGNQKFGLKWRHMRVQVHSTFSGYREQETVLICEKMRDFNLAGTQTPINAPGTIYDCTRNEAASTFYKSAESAQRGPKELASTLRQRIAYIPSRRLARIYFEQEFSELDRYK